MEVEIFLHGTPKGYNFVGKSDEFSYCSTFYTNRNESEKLVIEIRNSVNKVYCYYTYIKSKNVSSIDIRPGGYVAITVRIDNYCKDTIAIFFILKSIYRKHVIGNFVQEVGDMTKYIVENLSVKEDELDNMMRTLVQLLSLQILSNDFVPVSMEVIPNKKGSEQQYNLLDCSAEQVLNAIKRNGRASVSLVYPSAQERQLRAKMESEIINMRHSLEDKLCQQEKQFQDLLSQNRDFHSEIEVIRHKLNSSEKDKLHLLDENAKLKSIINDLKNKERKLSEQANLRDEIAKVSEPLLRLNGLLQRYWTVVPSLQNNQTSIRRFDADFEKRRPEKVSSFKNSNIWKIALLIFALASILLLTVLFFQIKLYSKYNSSYVEEPKVELKTDIEPTNVIESKTEQVSSVIENFDGARIDIKGYSGKGGLQYGKEYILFVSDRYSKPIEDVDGIKWHCDGGFIDTYDRASARLKVKRDSGYVRIACYLPNGRSIERELKIHSVTEGNSSMQASRPSPVRISKKEESVSKQQPSKNSKFKE